MHPFDELIIPQPPYRRTRPEVRLASVEIKPPDVAPLPEISADEPIIPLADTEPKQESVIEQFEREIAPAMERIHTPESAVEAVTQEAEKGIEEIQQNPVAEQTEKDTAAASVRGVEERFKKEHPVSVTLPPRQFIPVPDAQPKEFEPGDAMIARPGSPEAESVRRAIEAADKEAGTVPIQKEEAPAVELAHPIPPSEVGNDTIYVKPGEKLPEQEEKTIEREYRGGIFNKIKELGKLVVERTRVLPFMETILPRLESVGARRMVEYRKLVQARAQGKLNHATEKYEYWKAATENSGAKVGIFCAWRERAWARRMHNAEGRVSRHNVLSERWISTHNGKQEQIKRRYDRELAPHVERVTVLGDRVRAIEGAQKELEGMLQEAVQKKASIDARERAKGNRTFSEGAQKAIRELNREIKETERRVRQASKEAARLRAPLARAQGRVAKIGGRIKTIQHRMAFADMEKYRHTDSVADEDVVESSAVPAERKQEQITPMTLVEKWNRLNLHPRIEDAKEYIAFTTDALDARPELHSNQRLLELTEKYLRKKYTNRDTKTLSRDIAFFRTKFLS